MISDKESKMNFEFNNDENIPMGKEQITEGNQHEQEFHERFYSVQADIAT